MQNSKVKNALLYGGVSKEEYERTKPLINRANQKIWKISSVFFEILFLILFVVSLVTHFAIKDKPEISEMFFAYMIPFGILSFYMIILVLVFQGGFKTNSNALLPLIYISMGVILISLGSISIVLDDGVSGAAFVVALIIFPFFVTDRPLRYIIFTFLAGIAYLLLSLFVKQATVELKVRDVILTTASILISIFISIVLNISRVRRNADLYTLELQRDTDALTSVKNVNAYDRKVDELKEKIQNHADVRFAIVIFDINDLKYINDSYGHPQGDQLIIRTAKLICDAFKHSPVYRIGGDEFVAILEGIDYSNREVLIRQLHERIDQIHHDAKNKKEDTSVAFGVGIYNPKNDFDYITVFSRADAEMYDNKRVVKARNAQKK